LAKCTTKFMINFPLNNYIVSHLSVLAIYNAKWQHNTILFVILFFILFVYQL